VSTTSSRDSRPLAISAVVAVLIVGGLAVVERVPPIVCHSIVVASSNEKSDLMAALAKEYSSSHNIAGCGPIVSAERIASGDVERMLAGSWSGAARPDVWAPQASSWVVLLSYQLSVEKRAAIVPSTPLPSIANSPLVVAMPRPLAIALGWPAHQPGWKDLLALAENPKGWAAVGQAQWGAFRLGKTDPATSTSGMHALIAAYYAATGKSSNLTNADIVNARPFVAAVERSVSHYADTADTFLRNLSVADDNGQALSYISAVTIEEQELWSYNQGDYSTPSLPPHIPLAAIYPSDGTLIADHPYVILQAPWVGSDKRQIANDFLQWLLAAAQQQRFAEAGFRDSRSTASGVLSSDTNVLRDQPALELRLPAPDILSSIESSWEQIRKSVHLLVLLNVRSVSALGSTAAAVAELSPGDVVEVWTVTEASGSGAYRRVLAPTAVGTGRASIQVAVESARAQSITASVYAAAEAAHSYFSRAPDPERINAIVLISDEVDDGAGPSLVDLERLVRPRPNGTLVRIYAVAFPGSSSTALKAIATASAGVFSEGQPAVAVRQALTNT
jgi:Ca-activated chloride channel family protein